MDSIVAGLPFANYLTRLEMLHFHVVGGDQNIRSHALLPSVTFQAWKQNRRRFGEIACPRGIVSRTGLCQLDRPRIR